MTIACVCYAQPRFKVTPDPIGFVGRSAFCLPMMMRWLCANAPEFVAVAPEWVACEVLMEENGKGWKSE
jgi:hypothetical protein